MQVTSILPSRGAVTKPSSVVRMRPSDFQFFRRLKKRLDGMRLATHANVKQDAAPQLHTFGTDFYAGTQALVPL